jgi:hypothetical protein
VLKLGFLALPARERRLYIEEVASRRDVSPVVVEKDFWVSWMLALLFRSECADALVFKGGTSLSKVFGAIDRFSEDIDLSLSPAFAGIDGPTATPTRTQADLWMARAQKACSEAVAERISPALATLARKEFGAGIARRLKAYRKNKSEANAAALREALWPGAGGGLQAFCREYQKYKTRPEDVREMIDELSKLAGGCGC